MNKTDAIPYTHWAYFPDEASARRCAVDLADYVTRIDPPWEEVPHWLLRAGRDVEIEKMIERHGEVEVIVKRHGGDYDNGEMGRLTGAPVIDGVLSPFPCEGGS